MSDPFEALIERARRQPRRIAFPEATDPRILEAAARLDAAGVARPLLVGDPETVERAAGAAGVDLGSIPVESPRDGEHRQACRDAAAASLAGRDPGPGGLDGLLDDPLAYGAALVRAGLADGVVAGAAHATALTLRAYLRIVRPAPDVRLVSSYFLMGLERPTAAGERLLAFADCGLVPAPEPDELAEIAWQTARQYRRLTGGEPRVALLSFSTRGSAEHPAVQRVRQATRALAERGPDFAFDGELQVDAALMPEVARSKAPGSPVAGGANVLVFPDLDAGNIGYKLVERLAGARAVGPLLQGLSRPANDLSRGCSADDVVLAAAVTALQCTGGDDGPLAV